MGVWVHISFFMSDLGGGGAQRRFFALAQALARNGHRADLVVASCDGAFRERVPPEARLFTAEGPTSRLPLLRRRRGLHVPASAGALADYLEAEAPDVVVSSSNPANLAALAAQARCARRRAGVVPVVISVNVDLDAALAGRNRLHSGLLKAMIRRHYPRADAVIAISQGVAASVAAVAGVPPERIVTIPNPVDCAAIRRQGALPVTHPWLAPGAPSLVLAVGKLKAQKDFETLIRAFARLRAGRPVNLVILGEGKRRARLTTLVRELDLSDCVDLPGFADNPHAWMARAALFVLSSRWEGFSNALAEALALGCPVVSTNCPSGPAELLQAGTLGPLVPVGDDAALAAAMAASLDRPCARGRLMARAEDFSVERAAARYLAVLHCVVSRPGKIDALAREAS
jgi:glycosyltransferase involved in cell wall biosynthesis